MCRLTLTIDLIAVALSLMILVAVPRIVALLAVNDVRTIGVLLTVEETIARCAALIVLGGRVTAAPVVGVDLHQTVISAAIHVLVRGVAVP